MTNLILPPIRIRATGTTTMTPEQTDVLQRITAINQATFVGWFRLATPMAIVQIESAFRQFARRYEPTIGDASYGYMQLLSGTARDLGYTGPCFPDMPDPSDIANNPSLVTGSLYAPDINLTLGMTYLRQGWDHLATAFGRSPSLSEFFAGYNEGYGAAARGRPDPAYVTVAIAAFRHWSSTLNEDNSDLAE